jgi:PAS domain S-box-containing protein
LAVAAALAAAGIRLTLEPAVGPYAPYLPFVLAVIVSARFLGRGPSFTATVVSALAASYLFLEPRNSFVIAEPAALANLILFLLVGITVSLLVSQLQASLISSAKKERILKWQTELINLSQDAIITVNANQVIQTWSAGAAELYGWTEEEAIGKPLEELLQSRSHVPQSDIWRTLERVGRWEGELLHTGRDGRTIITDSRQIVVRTEGGAPGGFLEINRDITARKQADEALRQSEQRVRSKLESILSPVEEIGELELQDIVDSEAIQSLMTDFYELSHIPVAILDTQGKVLVGVGWQDICTQYHRLHPETLSNCIESDTQLTSGIAPGDFKLYKCKNNLCDVATPFVVAGRHLGNLFTGQFLLQDEPAPRDVFVSQAHSYGFDERKYLAALAEVPRLNRPTVERAISFLRKFGEMVGQLSYANIKLAKSVSELQRVKDEVLQLNQTLERRVAERTAQLQEANRELEAFSYSVSHDLRAPLRSVDGFAKILLRDYPGRVLDEMAIDYMSRMRTATQRMGQLIADLLALSRLTRQEMTWQSVNLSEIVRSVVAEYQSREPGRQVQTEIEPEIVSRADPHLTQVALENLLANAWKYTGKKDSARIAFGSVCDNGTQVYFVRDNGAGFDMAHAEQLFTPFHRLHRSEEFEGNGIGLATVQRVVRRHGGRVWAEAQPGEGATFYFTLGGSGGTGHSVGGRQ